jgi:hypothetical protein
MVIVIRLEDGYGLSRYAKDLGKNPGLLLGKGDGHGNGERVGRLKRIGQLPAKAVFTFYLISNSLIFR